MLERILRVVVIFCAVSLSAGFLFYLFFVKGLEWHEQAMAKLTKPPIDISRNTK
jgi:hypothetical protein